MKKQGNTNSKWVPSHSRVIPHHMIPKGMTASRLAATASHSSLTSNYCNHHHHRRSSLSRFRTGKDYQIMKMIIKKKKYIQSEPMAMVIPRNMKTLSSKVDKIFNRVNSEEYTRGKIPQVLSLKRGYFTKDVNHAFRIIIISSEISIFQQKLCHPLKFWESLVVVLSLTQTCRLPRSTIINFMDSKSLSRVATMAWKEDWHLLLVRIKCCLRLPEMQRGKGQRTQKYPNMRKTPTLSCLTIHLWVPKILVNSQKLAATVFKWSWITYQWSAEMGVLIFSRANGRTLKDLPFISPLLSLPLWRQATP